MSEQTDTPTVNTLGFSEWSTENVYADPLESRLKFGDYVREEFIKADAYTPDVETGVRQGLADMLREGGLLEPDGANAEELAQRMEDIQRGKTFDQLARTFQQSLPEHGEDQRTLDNYFAAAVESPSPEYAEELQPLREKAGDVVNRNRDQLLRVKVDAGELPMARLSNGQLIVGEAAARMDLVDAIKASSEGGVAMGDALAAQAQLETPDGFSIPLYRIQRLARATRLLEVERKQNEDFDIQLDGLSTEAAQSEYSTMDWLEHKADNLGRGISNFFGRIMGQGEDIDKAEERREAVNEARGSDIRQIAAKYALKFDMRPEDMELAVEQMVLDNAVNKQMFEFHDADDDDVGKNLRIGGYGLPTMSVQAMINKDVFDKTLAANPELSGEVKTMLNKQRISHLRSEFTQLDKFLSDYGSSVSDEWNKALIAGRTAGVEDYKILEGFVADKDNYNEFAERAAGIGMSFLNGVGQLFAAIPAAFGFDPAQDYLASVSQKNADRRQLAAVFGEEFGLLQDAAETAFPMLIDIGATVLLAAATAPAGGAGGVAYASLKAGGTATASMTAKGMFKSITSNVFRKTGAKSTVAQAEDLLEASLIKGTKEGAVDILNAYNSKLSAHLGNLPAIFIPAATRSGSATYGAVYNQLKQDPSVSEEDAHDRALGAMLMAGTFTGVLTAAFSTIGRGGVEDALLKGLSYKQMKRAGEEITGKLGGDFLSAAQKAIKTTMKKYSFGGVKGLAKNVFDEGVEESIDEFVNGLVTDAALHEDTPMLERLQQTWHAFVLGGIMGGSVPLVQRTFRALQPDVLREREKTSFYEDVLEEMSADLTANGAPVTAQYVNMVVSDMRRKDARASVIPSLEEQEAELGRREPEATEEGTQLPSGITPDPEMEALLEEKVNPDSAARAVNNVLGSSVPTVAGADPTTVEAKGNLMHQLELPVQEAGALENSDHQAVRNLIPRRTEGVEPDVFEGTRPPKKKAIIDPARAEEAEAIEVGFRETVRQIDEAEALYKKMDQQVAGAEVAGESSVRRALEQRVREGKAVSPEQAIELRGEAFKDRVLALKDLKVEQKLESPETRLAALYEQEYAQTEERQREEDFRDNFGPEDLETGAMRQNNTVAVDGIIRSGFPQVLTVAKLKRLGIPFNQDTTSAVFLREANHQIQRQISEAYPKLPVTRPEGGFALDSAYGQGKVFLDRVGRGQFNNDPLTMLSLLETGASIVVDPAHLDSPTLNPAFRFARVGDNVVVSDIMVPESGGLVSALTPTDRALVLQPDYTRVVDLVERVLTLRDEGLREPDAVIDSPFEPNTQTTAQEVLTQLEEGVGIDKFVTPNTGELAPEFAESAQIELRLRAQEALFTDGKVSLVGLGREVADTYMAEQTARLKHSKESFVASVSVNEAADLQADPDYNAASEVEDTYTPFPENAPPPFPESGISNLLNEAHADAVAALDGDSNLRQSVVLLVQNEVFNTSSIDFNRTSTKRLWSYVVQWMAQGNHKTSPASIEFQKALKGRRFEMGTPVREALQLMALSSASVEGTPKTDAAYRAFLRDKIRGLKGGAEPSDAEVFSFHNYVRGSVGALLLRSQPSGMSKAHDQKTNKKAIAALGLKDGDPESIIEALERIVGVSDRAQKEYDSHLVSIARLLLQSPDFIRSIELSIDETDLNYAGKFDTLTDGTPAISININGHNPRGVADTLVHELIHAYVTGVTRKPAAQQTRQEAAAIGLLEGVIADIRADFKAISNQETTPVVFSQRAVPSVMGRGRVYKYHDTRVYDALANVDEFVAHFLTSTDFQKFVKTMLADRNAPALYSRFEQVVAAIRSFFLGANPEFDSAFSAVLDLSHSSVLAAGPRRRSRRKLISVEEFLTLPNKESRTAKDFVADSVFPTDPATNSTTSKEPVTTESIVGKIAEDVSRSQQEAVRLSSGVQGATGVDVDAQQRGRANVERLLSLIRNRIVPPEMRMEVDTSKRSVDADGNMVAPPMMYVDSNTGTLIVNPLELSGLLKEFQANNGGRPLSIRTQMNITAVIANEEIAHAASVATITKAERDELINGMTFADAEETVSNYGDEGNVGNRERLLEGWRNGDPAAQREIVEERLRQHAQKVTRGFTTEEEIAFLRRNPNLVQQIIRYFQRFLKKLGYYRSRRDISPQMRTAVDRVVNEIRALEAGYRYSTNLKPFDPNNPESVIEQFRKQANMNKPIERADEPREAEPAMAASGITAQVPADAGEVIDARGWTKVGRQLGSNMGGVYEDGEGNKFYFKESKSPEHARNEVLATILYETAGADILPIRLATGKNAAGEDVLGTASEWREDFTDFDPQDPAMRKAAFPDFAIHAWLANWDVVGLVYDNLMVDGEGNVVHVDTGGALKFRAQGEPKGGAWNEGGSEFATLRVMGQAGEVFGGMSTTDLQNSANELRKMSDDVIRSAVERVMGVGADGTDMANTLIARRNNILNVAFGEGQFVSSGITAGRDVQQQAGVTRGGLNSFAQKVETGVVSASMAADTLASLPNSDRNRATELLHKRTKFMRALWAALGLSQDTFQDRQTRLSNFRRALNRRADDLDATTQKQQTPVIGDDVRKFDPVDRQAAKELSRGLASGITVGDFDFDGVFPEGLEYDRFEDGRFRGTPLRKFQEGMLSEGEKPSEDPLTEKDVEELEERLKKLTVEGEVGRYWYEDAAKKILEITNGNVVEAEKLIALLAIYSPQTGVQVNTYFAIRGYEQHANKVSRKDYKVKTAVQDNKARAVLYDNRDWVGRKTDNFYKNIMFHIVQEATPEQLRAMRIDTAFLEDIQQPVTVDMWVYRALGYDTIGLTDKEGKGPFGFSEKMINRLTYSLNQNLAEGEPRYEAHQVQAMIWTAIKARSENKAVKKKTEAESIAAGDLVRRGKERIFVRRKVIKMVKGEETEVMSDAPSERDHQRRWTENALAATGVDFVEASRSFDYFVNSMGLLATWEVIASEQTEMGKRLAAMSIDEKRSFTEQAMRLIIDPTTGEDLLAKELGIALSTSKISTGGYAGGVTPNVLSTLYPNKPADVGGKETYDDDAIRAYARSLQYIFMQDAVPWARFVKHTKQDVFYKVSKRGTTSRGGVRFETQEEAEKFAASENAKIDTGKVVKVEDGEGYQIQNKKDKPYKLRSKETKKMEETPVFVPTVTEDPDLTEQQRIDKADKEAREAAESFRRDNLMHIIGGNNQSHGFHLTFGENLTESKEQEIQDFLTSVHPDFGFTKVGANEIVVINYKMDYMGMLPVLTDGVFAAKINQQYGQEAELAEITTVGEYGYHDWGSDSAAEGIFSLSTRFTPAVQQRLRGWRQGFQRISAQRVTTQPHAQIFRLASGITARRGDEDYGLASEAMLQAFEPRRDRDRESALSERGSLDERREEWAIEEAAKLHRVVSAQKKSLQAGGPPMASVHDIKLIAADRGFNDEVTEIYLEYLSVKRTIARLDKAHRIDDLTTTEEATELLVGEGHGDADVKRWRAIDKAAPEIDGAAIGAFQSLTFTEWEAAKGGWAGRSGVDIDPDTGKQEPPSWLDRVKMAPQIAKKARIKVRNLHARLQEIDQEFFELERRRKEADTALLSGVATRAKIDSLQNELILEVARLRGYAPSLYHGTARRLSIQALFDKFGISHVRLMPLHPEIPQHPDRKVKIVMRKGYDPAEVPTVVRDSIDEFVHEHKFDHRYPFEVYKGATGEHYTPATGLIFLSPRQSHAHGFAMAKAGHINRKIAGAGSRMRVTEDLILPTFVKVDKIFDPRKDWRLVEDVLNRLRRKRHLMGEDVWMETELDKPFHLPSKAERQGLTDAADRADEQAADYYRLINGKWDWWERPEVVDAVFDLGFDAMLVSESPDSHGVQSDGRMNLAVRDPEKLKTAHPRTYDRDGNLIPPSKRFDESKDAHMYSGITTQFGWTGDEELTAEQTKELGEIQKEHDSILNEYKHILDKGSQAWRGDGGRHRRNVLTGLSRTEEVHQGYRWDFMGEDDLGFGFTPDPEQYEENAGQFGAVPEMGIANVTIAEIAARLQPLVNRAAEIAGWSHRHMYHGTSYAEQPAGELPFWKEQPEPHRPTFGTFDPTKSDYAGPKGLVFFSPKVHRAEEFIGMQEGGGGHAIIPVVTKADMNIFDPRTNWEEFVDVIVMYHALEYLGPEAEGMTDEEIVQRFIDDNTAKGKAGEAFTDQSMNRIKTGNWIYWEKPLVVDAIMAKYDGMLVSEPVTFSKEQLDEAGLVKDEHMNLALRNPSLVKSVAPITLDSKGEIVPLSERFNPASPAFIHSGITFGDASDLPSEFNSEGVDYSQFIEVLEMPFIEKGPFQKVKGTWRKLFKGETDPTVQRYVRQRDAFLRTNDKIVEEYHSKYKSALEKDFPNPDDIPWDDIQAATGTTDNIDPDPDNVLLDARNKEKDAAHAQYQADLATEYAKHKQAEDAEKAKIATEPDPDKRKTLYRAAADARRAKQKASKAALGTTKGAADEAAQQKYEDAKDKSFETKKADMIKDRNEAFDRLRSTAPSLFPVLLDLRRLTDELSAQAKSLFGVFSAKDLSVKFDNNMGLYVTRRYHMFSDTDYVERILRSEATNDKAVRDAAIDFMRDQFIKFEFDRFKQDGRSDADALAAAEAKYDSRERGGQSLGYQMARDFLQSFDTDTGPMDFASAFDFAGKPASLPARLSDSLKALTKNLEGRAEIPKPLADLMGANNVPEDSIDSLLYTLGTVSKIAAHQSFLNKMRQQGEVDGWLMTNQQKKDAEKKAKTKEEFDRISSMKPIVSSGADSGLNPLAGMWVDRDVHDDIQPMFQQTVREPNDASSRVLHNAMTYAQKATGFAMAAKTLGSVGFYLRNMLSNVLFFGPAQGYWGAGKSLISGDPTEGTGMSAVMATGRAFRGNAARSSAYLRELEALGVFGDEVRSEIMLKLMRGEETFASLESQLQDLNKRAATIKGAKALQSIQNTAARLGSAMDSFYKIGYFEHELAVIEEAAKHEEETGMPKKDRKYSLMEPYQRKQHAADIISATAQSYARALPVIKKISGSGFGLLFAPFIRFTAEVPRIAVNTFTLARKEMKDSNPVIKARGRRRMTGFSAVAIFSTAVPAMLQKLLSDMGEDEDEAFRMSLPPYLRNHTFYYFRGDSAIAKAARKLSGGKEGDLTTFDLTYLNPFAVIADPFLRGMEHLVRGEPMVAAEKIVTTAFLEPYLGDQILAGSIVDVKENRDARSGRPIYEESDPLWRKLGKMSLYVGKEAYGPRTPMKFHEAWKSAGGEVNKFADSPFGIILSEFYPVRPRSNDPADQFSRVVYQLRDEQRRVQQRFNKLKQSKGMGEREVKAIHRDIRKSRMRINSKLSQAMRGFNGLGVNNYDLYQQLRGARYGERRSKLLFSGFMENPVPTTDLVETLMRTPQGQQRLRWLMEEHSENPRFLKLDD